MEPRQIQLLRNSWIKIVPICDATAELFYRRLFKVAPETRRLFPDDMTTQKKSLITMLSRTVSSFHDPTHFVSSVESLGIRHSGYGVTPEHYKVFGEAMFWAFECALGSEWTPEVQKAWSDAFQQMSTTMIAAAGGHPTRWAS